MGVTYLLTLRPSPFGLSPIHHLSFIILHFPVLPTFYSVPLGRLRLTPFTNTLF